MNRTMFRNFVLAAAVAVVGVVMTSEEAQAWPFHNAYGWGSHGGGGSYWLHNYDSGSAGSYHHHAWNYWRPHRHHGLLVAHRSHLGYGSAGYGHHRGYGWGSAGYGSHGSVGYASGGSHGGYVSHGSHGGSYGWGSHGSAGYSSCGSSGGNVVYETPVYQGGEVIIQEQQGDVYYQQQQPTIQQQDDGAIQQQDIPDVPSDARVKSDEAALLVSVPADAKVFVNGNETTSEGARRQFVSRDLKAGLNYRYEVRAEKTIDGKVETQTRVVNLTGGDTAMLAFDFAQGEELALKPTETVLTVNVPENAKLFLAGRETSTTGAQRVFRTHKLAAGQTWDDYAVKVTVERDGQMVSQQQVIKLAAGDQKVLTFGFTGDELAVLEGAATR